MPTIRASLRTRLGAAGAVAIMATGGVMATAATANASNGHHPKPKPRLVSTSLSIKNKAIAHAKHHADLITGVLTARKKGVAGETITLESRTGKKPRWTSDGTATTSSTGSVSFTVAPTVKTQFKLVFAGDSTYRKSASNVITLKAVKK
jgi:hypothetical protein